MSEDWRQLHEEREQIFWAFVVASMLMFAGLLGAIVWTAWTVAP